MKYLRSEVVKLINSWIGKNEKDGSYKSIIDIYNSFTGDLPRGIKMSPAWAWCACTWSALAIKLGYTSIMPIEISCAQLIDKAKSMGCWQENDCYIANPGDAVLYDWDDSGSGDSKGWPDHVGTIVNRASGYYTVVEGNHDNAVKVRTLSINGKYIRGFITPKYDPEPTPTPVKMVGKSISEVAHEVITGVWGSGDARKKALEAAGYNYSEVQNMVNTILNGSVVKAKAPAQSQNQPSRRKVTATCVAHAFASRLAGKYQTTANLYLRNDAGTNKKALCLIPKYTEVTNFGYYSGANLVKWLYIQVVIDGVLYTGFSSSKYLKMKIK